MTSPLCPAPIDDGVVVGARRRRMRPSRPLGHRPILVAGSVPRVLADRHLAHLRAPDVAALPRPSAASSCSRSGAIEQHGPHLPLNTDLLVAERVAEAAVDRVGDELDVWLLPPLAVHQVQRARLVAGHGLAVGDDAARRARRHRALRRHDAGRSGSCSSTATAATARCVNVANRELRLHHGLMTFLAHPGVPADQGGASPADELGMGVHGGTDETSLMLHLAPELVDMTAAARTRPRAPRRQPLRALRRAGVVRLAVERLRPRRRTSATRPAATRRARRRAVRRRGRRRSATALREIAAFEYRDVT